MPTHDVISILRAQVQAGIDALERGDFIDIADEDLDAALDALVEDPSKPSPP